MAAAKDSKKAPELVKIRFFNGHTTSAGNHAPGDVAALPPDEAQPFLDQGYAVRVAS